MLQPQVRINMVSLVSLSGLEVSVIQVRDGIDPLKNPLLAEIHYSDTLSDKYKQGKGIISIPHMCLTLACALDRATST